MMKIRWHGMLGTLHSWSIVSQALAREMAGMGHQVFLKSTNSLEHFPDDLRHLLLPGYHDVLQKGKAEYIDELGKLSIVTPQAPLPDVPDRNRPYDMELAYTVFLQGPRRFFEESRCRALIWNFESSILPPGWHLYARSLDYILPSSQFSYDIFAANGVPRDKMLVVPHGVDTSIFNPAIPPFPLKTQKKVKFLHNAIPHHRKLHERVIRGYLDAFTGNDDVCLVMKTQFIKASENSDKMFEVDVRQILERELSGRDNPPEIEVLTSFVPDIGALYTACDAVVSMSATEGFCLLPHMEVDTTKGPLQISTIGQGLSVITHNGRMRMVEGSTTRKYDGPIISFRRLGDDMLLAGTPEHPHAIVPKNGRRFHQLRKAIEKDGEQPVWTPLGHLKVGDLVALPKFDLSVIPIVRSIKISDHVSSLLSDDGNFQHNNETVSLTSLADSLGCSFQYVSEVLSGKVPTNTILAKRIVNAANKLGYRKPQPVCIKDDIELEPEFGFFCGLYISEGSPISEGAAVHFASHIDETVGRTAIMAVAKKLGVHAAENTKLLKGSVTISSKILSSFLSSVFGHGALHKTIPMWLWNSPVVRDIVAGIFYGDGSCSNDKYSFSTSSPKLAFDLRQILASHGIMCHFTRDNRGEKTNYVVVVAAQHNMRFASFVRPMKYSKHIVIPNGIKNTAIMENEQFFFVPIRMLEQIEYHGDVHNLHIEEDCSFSVGGMATHNCLPLLEALACGSVVIAPRHGGQLDFLNDSNSLLVNTGEMKAPKTMQYWIAHPDAVVGDPDTKHFSELLQKVYQNPVAEKKRIGEAAAKTVAEFSWNKAAHMILDLPIPKTSARMPTKKKILYVVPYGMVGGAEHWVRETICRLDRSKYDPHVAFATGGSMALHEMFGGIATVEDLGKQGREQGLRCLLESENYSVIHFYNSFGVYSLLNDMWKNGYRCRIVETVHSELVWPDSMSKVGIRNDPVLLIASVSNTLAGKLARIGNKNVVSFPQHIDWKRFKVPRSKEILRQLGIGEDTFTVGFVGRLSPEKNLSVILQCARLMPEVSFVIVGDGPQATPLMSMSKNMGNVFFAGRRGDTEHFYAAFDILMLPSLVEGMPLVLLEAMCCGTPVIASNVGAVGEAISNGKNGFLVQNPCDVQSYVRAVRALAEPGVWEACSIGAVETARTMRDRSEHFDVNGFYDMLFTQVRQ